MGVNDGGAGGNTNTRQENLRLTSMSKGSKTCSLLRAALKRNELFAAATNKEIDQMIGAFRRIVLAPGALPMIQGKHQPAFYVVESGELDVYVGETQRTPTRQGMATRKVVRRTATLSTGNSFGERSISENRVSAATIRAASECVVWMVDKDVFNAEFLIDKSKRKRREAQQVIREALEKHPYFCHLQDEAAERAVIDSFFDVRFQPNEVIVYDGSHGDNYYIVSEGTVDVYRKLEPSHCGKNNNDPLMSSAGEINEKPLDHLIITTPSGKDYTRVRTLNSGDWFGELTLKFPNMVSQYRYIARTPCKLHAMERSYFQQLAQTGAHHLRERFDFYASARHPDAGTKGHPVEERIMTVDDFFRCQLAIEDNEKTLDPKDPDSKYHSTPISHMEDRDRGATIGLLKLLFQMANTDTRSDGLDFNDYYALNVLMSRPHSEYEIAFRILDARNEGMISRKQLGLLLLTIAGYRGKKLAQHFAYEDAVATLISDDGPPIMYEDFQRMIDSGELPCLVNELVESIRSQGATETQRRGVSMAAAALADSAIASVYAEQHDAVPTLYATMIAGGFAGAASRTLTAPLERLALLMQIQRMHRSMSRGTQFKMRYSGVLNGLSLMVKEGGVQSLFWGNMTNLARLIPTRGISFSLFEAFKDWNRTTCDARERAGATDLPESKNMLSLPVLAFGGGISAGLAAALCYPMDVIRTRVTVQQGDKAYKGVADIFRSMSKRQLYQGFTPTLIKTAPEWGINFALYDMMKESFVMTNNVHGQVDENNADYDTKAAKLLICGGLASAVSQTVIYPLDVIRRKMQVQDWSFGKHDGILATYRRIRQTKGWRGLYSGLVPTYLRVVPATATGFALYSLVLESLTPSL